MHHKNLQCSMLKAAVVLLIIFILICTGCTQVDNGLPPEPEETLTVQSENEVAILEEGQQEETAPDEPAELEQPLPDGYLNGEQQPLPVIADGNYLLALVTKETILQSDYKPADLRPVPPYMNPSYSMQLRAEALEHLETLWRAAEADGVILHIRSAYRSFDTQKGLFQDYASRHGEKEANRFSARAGQSEHQLGTAVDFGGTSVDFKTEFAKTSQGRWLAENAHLYGFAMSYPQGQEEMTGYIFEPWHYRYIGVVEAVKWKGSGKTLKEYLESKPQFYE